MIHETVKYADGVFRDIKNIKRDVSGSSVTYGLSVEIQGRSIKIAYFLIPYGEEKVGGDAQLIIDPFLDMRFEQESTNEDLNKDTDIAHSYFKAAVENRLYVEKVKFLGIPLNQKLIIKENL